ncbi:MAG: class I SAM-dependent methyltransferase [Planctomycetaceae bacterium]|nr:class I SAM-dependent methyltransferase [Planctomycetaceae bacterium]
MSQEPQPFQFGPDDLDADYRAGTPVWDANKPHTELIRVFEEYRLRPETVLEVGCGTGADAVWLARRRYEVTAVDSSAIAIERARLRAEQQDAVLRFVLEDAFVFAQSAGQFDFVYDAGLYHSAREKKLEKYLDMLWRVTRPGSYYLCLAAAPSEPIENGPPQVSDDEIRNELGRLFEFVHLRPIRLETSNPSQNHPAWSCFMRRPLVGV